MYMSIQFREKFNNMHSHAICKLTQKWPFQLSQIYFTLTCLSMLIRKTFRYSRCNVQYIPKGHSMTVFSFLVTIQRLRIGTVTYVKLIWLKNAFGDKSVGKCLYLKNCKRISSRLLAPKEQCNLLSNLSLHSSPSNLLWRI